MSAIAAEKLKVWRDRPDIFVQDVFGITPDPWQAKVLQAFPQNQRMAMAACKGPGKTAVLAWIVWNFLVTRPHPKIAATSITGDNLSDNLWAELAKFQQKSKLLTENFTWGKTRIYSNEYPETWWVSARPWSKSASPEEQGMTLAGLHADYILFVLDESGGIPMSVMASADAALSSCIEGHIVQAGNTTHTEGPLHAACTNERHLWHVTHITADPDDPERTPRVSIKWAQETIDRYGRDNPYVLINVFGKFPPSSINALIGIDDIKAAMTRDYKIEEYARAAKVLGIDVAREGMDTSVIFPRQGLQAFTPMQYRNITGTYGAEMTARKINEWGADASFVDNTGGFGSSWIDNLNRLGFSPIPVHFNEKSANPRYFNKRTEMLFEAVEWIKGGGSLPYNEELIQELTNTTYTFRGDKVIIEPKEIIKAKLGRSPDLLDALALTFASPVAATYGFKHLQDRHQINYQPLSLDYIKSGVITQGKHEVSYNPLSLDYLRRG